jgi:hypothetical protein
VEDFVQSRSLSVEAGAALLGYIDLKPYHCAAVKSKINGADNGRRRNRSRMAILLCNL